MYVPIYNNIFTAGCILSERYDIHLNVTLTCNCQILEDSAPNGT